MFSIPSFSGFKISPYAFSGLLISGTFSSPANRLYAISNLSNSPNTTFNTNIGSGINNYVWDGVTFKNKIYVGGFFTTYNGVTSNYFAILNKDGSLFSSGIGTGFNQSVRKILVQEDGKIICAGQFTSYNGVSINRIVRLNENLTIDGTFNVGVGFNSGEVNTFDSDGTHIYVVGNFTAYKGITRNRFVKIRMSNGDDDTGVNSGFNGTNTFGAVVVGDNLFMGGENFNTFNGVTVPNRLCKVNKNTLVVDSTFTSNMGSGADSRVFYTMTHDSNFVYINGSVTTLNGVSIPRFGRFSLDGIADSSFVFSLPGGSILYNVLIHNKTKLALCGAITNINGNPNYNRFAVINLSTNTFNNSYAVNFNTGSGTFALEF